MTTETLTTEELEHLRHCLEYRDKTGGWSVADRNSGRIARHRELQRKVAAELESREQA